MSKNVKLNNQNYTGVSTVQIPTTNGGIAVFKDADEIVTPSGAKTITANGTYDVSAFAQAIVNVPTGGASPVYQEKTVTENGEVTPDAGFDALSKVIVNVPTSGGGDEKTDYYEYVGGGSSSTTKQTVRLKHHGKVLTLNSRSNAYDLYWQNAEITVDDDLEEIGANSLQQIGSSGSFALFSNNNFANLHTVGTTAFMGSGIAEINFPNVTKLEYGNGAGGQFNKCSKLTSITLPKLTKWNAKMAPTGMGALTSVQIGSVGYGITAVPADGDFKGATSAGFAETLFTTGEYIDTILTAMRSGEYGNATATIIIKAAAETTYSGQTYAAGDTIITDTPEA